MSAKQGQRYRVINPAQGERLPKINGVEYPIERFISRIFNENDEIVEVIDVMGDVINASENVPYPKGSSDDYRNIQWINEHIERFELIN